MSDFDGWEVLQPELKEEVGHGGVEVAAEAQEGLMMLRLDYFSVDSGTGDRTELSSEGGSVESDTPSWIDPDESDAAVFRRRDSGIDRSKMSDCGETIGLGIVHSGDDHHVFEVDRQLGFLEGGHQLEKFSAVSDDSEEKMVVTDYLSEEITNEMEIRVGEEETSAVAAEGGEIGKEVLCPNEVEKMDVIWWKVPLALVKFCVFRASPLWSISVAAAMVGVFIIRRRLQSMTRKTKSVQVKVTVDHKKVDQFMSPAARLNEVFSVVKRVPIIRPSLPAPGVSPWPNMSLW